MNGSVKKGGDASMARGDASMAQGSDLIDVASGKWETRKTDE